MSQSKRHVSSPSTNQIIVFFFKDTATTEIYTLSLHDALPIWNETAPGRPRLARRPQRRRCGSGFYVLGGRDIARIDWGGEEGLRIEGPELADVGGGLYPRIYRLEEHTSEIQ